MSEAEKISRLPSEARAKVVAERMAGGKRQRAEHAPQPLRAKGTVWIRRRDFNEILASCLDLNRLCAEPMERLQLVTIRRVAMELEQALTTHDRRSGNV